jgi:hypothetical protein
MIGPFNAPPRPRRGISAQASLMKSSAGTPHLAGAEESTLTRRPYPARDVPAKLTVEDILSDELKREMNLDTDTFAVLDDWDSVLNSVYQLPIEYAGYTSKVGEMKLLREMIDTLASANFDHVKRSESRKKQLAQFKKTLSMYYNVVFTKGEKKVGYGALIHFPKLRADPDRSGGIVLAAKIVVDKGKRTSTFERGKFDDFLVEVKPYVNLLGDLYRQTRKM